MALSKITTESLLDGEITAAKFATGVGGKVVQVVNVQSGAVATGTTVIPQDDTIPQKTEGTEFLTLAITPTHASNKLIIDIVLHLSSSADNWMLSGLFQDTTANALNSSESYLTTTNGAHIHTYTHFMAAGTTSATTFKVRAGGDSSSTITLNGAGAARKLGGVLSSSITITEILV
jgi:hypothetical protein